MNMTVLTLKRLQRACDSIRARILRRTFESLCTSVIISALSRMQRILKPLPHVRCRDADKASVCAFLSMARHHEDVAQRAGGRASKQRIGVRRVAQKDAWQIGLRESSFAGTSRPRTSAPRYTAGMAVAHRGTRLELQHCWEVIERDRLGKGSARLVRSWRWATNERERRTMTGQTDRPTGQYGIRRSIHSSVRPSVRPSVQILARLRVDAWDSRGMRSRQQPSLG